MLLGEAITDRFSPRLIRLTSDVIRFLSTALMALVVFTGGVQIWMLYAFSLGFGLVAGFAIPAGNSIVPLLVEEQDLQAGNSIMLSVVQLAGVDFSLLLLLGIGNGYFTIIIFTWMQTRTPKEMLGRMMSILMFSGTGFPGNFRCGQQMEPPPSVRLSRNAGSARHALGRLPARAQGVQREPCGADSLNLLTGSARQLLPVHLTALAEWPV
jgi:hypothetical protein